MILTQRFGGINKIIMKSSNKYKSILTVIVSSLLLTNCGETYKEEIVDYVNPQGSIYVLRNNFKGQDLTISESTLEGANHIGGVIISNHESKNLPENTVAIQSTWRGQTRGILLEVEDASKYAFGDSINMDLIGSTLTGRLGSLMITNVPSSKISKISSGNIKEHTPVAVSTLEKKKDQFESTLISVTADVDPEPAKGSKLAGVHKLLDGENKSINISVDESSPLANNALSPSATFRGVLYSNQGELEIRLQKSEDLAFPSGKLYSGWPETFEQPDTVKAGYAKWPVILPTGEWTFDQSMLGNTVGRDRIVSGKLAVRFQQNLKTPAYLQMNFDVPQGASKVTLWYGSYYTDRSSTFQLEYSIDQGKTWKIVDKPISDAHPTSVSLVAKQAVFLMNITEPVRFRINKLGLGTSSNTINNGRLGIDDIAIYQSY